jgi:hypothetical protein
MVNPDNPTPRGYGYKFFNKDSGEPVYIDDCQHRTGWLVEIKGNYDWRLLFKSGMDDHDEKWLDQSFRQVQTTPGRQLFWVFSQENSARYARKLFNDAKGGREEIDILVVPKDGALQ